MKKILFILTCLAMFTGCSVKSKPDVINEFITKNEKSKSYKLDGTMELISNEETYNYQITTEYLKDNYYKVTMNNTDTNHTQVILKNDEGLYVITPSLNKSFKFESTWPLNSSQSYVLISIINDLKNDEKASFSEENDGYVIKCKVNYPNNDELDYEKIYIDKDYIIKKVEVYNNADIIMITTKFNNCDLTAGLSKKDFQLSDYIKEKPKLEEKNEEEENLNENENESTEKTFSKIENAIYPLYMPSNTYLTASEVINNDSESRVILTFAGDKNFVIVEENALANEEMEIIPIYGDPVMLNNTIGALEANSMYWTSNDMEYYLVSSDLSITEMVTIATSLGNSKSTIYTK